MQLEYYWAVAAEQIKPRSSFSGAAQSIPADAAQALALCSLSFRKTNLRRLKPVLSEEENMKLSHRTMISLAVGLLLLCPLSLLAQLSKKPYTEWSDKEAQKVL